MNNSKWSFDAAHSEINFKVKHMMISNMKGAFQKFDVAVSDSDTSFTNATVTATIDAASIDTRNADRDTHLKAADFLEVEKYPQIIFKSTSFTRKSGNDFKLAGDLTIKGITKPVILDVELGGINKDPWGNERAGFSFSGKINRKDFGLNWNAVLETGGVLVSDDVFIDGGVELIKG